MHATTAVKPIPSLQARHAALSPMGACVSIQIIYLSPRDSLSNCWHASCQIGNIGAWQPSHRATVSGTPSSLRHDS